MIAIGIDPGTVCTGYGVVRKDGSRLTRLASGTISTNQKTSMEQRLLTIAEGIELVVTTYGPDISAVEDIFVGKNVKSTIKLGQARGAILVTLAKLDLPVTSFPPALIKRSVVGSGRAAKAQIQQVVMAILGMSEKPQEDEADGLAVAICLLNSPSIPNQPPASTFRHARSGARRRR
jgi:crossover junction endodeoxyribonuclease RuvC